MCRSFPYLVSHHLPIYDALTQRDFCVKWFFYERSIFGVRLNMLVIFLILSLNNAYSMLKILRSVVMLMT